MITLARWRPRRMFSRVVSQCHVRSSVLFSSMMATPPALHHHRGTMSLRLVIMPHKDYLHGNGEAKTQAAATMKVLLWVTELIPFVWCEAFEQCVCVWSLSGVCEECNCGV